MWISIFLFSFAFFGLLYLFGRAISRRDGLPKDGSSLSNASKYKVVVIGAGFSGLIAAIKLKRLGIPFVILEKASRIGGTWWLNKYPGCACDVPSHLYSISFEPGDWTRAYSNQPEILAYLERVAKKYDLYPSIRFETEVKEARWNEKASNWEVKVSTPSSSSSGKQVEEIICANFIIGGQGGLHVPHKPKIEGAETFKGQFLHTAEWDTDFSAKNKSIAFIGNAASAVQAVPELAREAKHITIFQRTANWLVPKEDPVYPSFLRFLFENVPPTRVLYRWFLYWKHELTLNVFTPDTFASRLGRQMIDQYYQKELKAKPELIASQTPSFPIGCKRIILGGDYFKSLTLPHVEVVTEKIDRITPEGIESGGKLYKADTIVYATGYLPMASFANFFGRGKLFEDGRKNLAQVWGDTPYAYFGICVPGMPNYFQMLGPNTALGHNSVVWMIECQVNYSLQCIVHVIQNDKKSIEVDELVAEKFRNATYARLDKLVWKRSNCRSWYQNEGGKIFALWPGSTVEYWRRTLKPNFRYFLCQ